MTRDPVIVASWEAKRKGGRAFRVGTRFGRGWTVLRCLETAALESKCPLSAGLRSSRLACVEYPLSPLNRDGEH